MDQAYSEARKARNTIYQEENFEEYARKHNLNIYSGEIVAKEPPKGELAAVEGLDQYLSSLKPDQITPVLSTPSGYTIIKLVSRETSRTPKLAEIRGIVEKRYVEEEARKLCRKEAEDTLRRLKAGAGMDAVAREKGLRIGATGYLSPGVDIPGIGRSLEIAQAVYLLSEKKPYPDQPFLVDDAYVIVRFKGRKLEATDFAIKKATIKAVPVPAQRKHVPPILGHRDQRNPYKGRADQVPRRRLQTVKPVQLMAPPPPYRREGRSNGSRQRPV